MIRRSIPLAAALALLCAGNASAQPTMGPFGPGPGASTGGGGGSYTPTSDLSTNTVTVPGGPTARPLAAIEADVYNVKFYGAKGDGQTLTDVTTTASSAAVSSASHNFTSADVGKMVSIYANASYSTTATTTNGSTTLTAVASVTNLAIRQAITGTGIPAGTYIQDIGPGTTTILMNKAATATATAVTLTFATMLNTTIASVSGGVATLALAPGVSLAGNAIMIFGTNDAVAINLASTMAANAGGAAIYLPTGMYIVNASISVGNNVSIRGEGAGKSIIKWIVAPTINNPTGEQFTGVIAGINNSVGASCTPALAAAQSNNQFSYLEIDGSSGYFAGSNYWVQAKGIQLACAVNASYDHLYIHDTPATGIGADFSFPGQFTNNLFVNPGRLGAGQYGANGIGNATATAGGDSYVMIGNVVINPAHYGLYVGENATTTTNSPTTISDNVVVAGGLSTLGSFGTPAGIGNAGSYVFTATGNIVVGTGSVYPLWNGISTDGGTLQSYSGAKTVVSGNDIYGTYRGIAVNYSGDPPSGSMTSTVVINGNHVEHSTSDGILLIPYSTGNSMDGVSVVGNVSTNNYGAGFRIAAGGTYNVKNLVLDDNIFSNNGAATGVDYQKAGIAIAATVTGLTMHGNRLFDENSTQKYGLSVNTGASITQAHITGNDFTGNLTSVFDLLGSITGILSDNMGMPAPTISGCGATSSVGNGDIGKYTSGTSGACAVTITPYGSTNIIANNGYICNGYDSTTPADLQSQTADTTTSATMSGTTVSGDVVKYACRMW